MNKELYKNNLKQLTPEEVVEMKRALTNEVLDAQETYDEEEGAAKTEAQNDLLYAKEQLDIVEEYIQENNIVIEEEKPPMR